MQISNLHYKPVAHTHVKRWRIVSKMCLEQASSVLVNKLHGNKQFEHSYEARALNYNELWAEILNTERRAIYQIEAIEKRYLVYKFQDFS
jgi:Txe/YoeB family toxin of Txe-Axe toxin-antitoxin module